MLRNDAFLNVAKLNDKDFEKTIKELRAKGTKGANVLADSFEETRKALNSEKLKGD
ncbi:hypothetical protein [Bacillus atrophaeus]|uniref:hypothetical protein n=1 Tax=Bacillus atrophaeus TaxID=1452 RepID=UPI000AED1A5A|nr:hypothetical protein [Bacillus atrophaeus]MED4806287.1 hypothetical protein [Bacillus atrophaeus]GED04296.1 hypothetical protein BAT02nite_39400 [Bacillus atrophaeus]